MLAPLELELQLFHSCHVCAGNQINVHFSTSPYILLCVSSQQAPKMGYRASVRTQDMGLHQPLLRILPENHTFKIMGWCEIEEHKETSRDI